MSILSQLGRKFDNDGFSTKTAAEQKEVEKLVANCLQSFIMQPENTKFSFTLESHLRYLTTSIAALPSSYQSLDASGPWLAFWVLHSLELLRQEIPVDLKHRFIKFLASCQSPDGGFGGGPGQIAHAATTYAAVMALCLLRDEAAYKIIDRDGLCTFFRRCCQKDGSFIMHEDGETDIRGVYCALAVASLTALPADAAFGCGYLEKCAQWLALCQTYEGGFSAEPGCEAHGGYTFCGVAAFILLSAYRNSAAIPAVKPKISVRKILRWCSYKQLSLEGGFQGRSNKLVDACYSYWQGAVFSLLRLFAQKLDNEDQFSFCQFDTQALRNYLFGCCQSKIGGFIDKPGKHRDLYHTCYALSGLSLTQDCCVHQSVEFDSDDIDKRGRRDDIILLADNDPLYNISRAAVREAIDYFSLRSFS